MSGGSDSLIGFWDFEDLICTGTMASNDYGVRCLDFTPCGTMLSALSWDESKKRSVLELYSTETRKKLINTTYFDSGVNKKRMAWHPGLQVANSKSKK